MYHDPDPALARRNVVANLSLGQRVAEEERDALAGYFVETEQWRQVWDGAVDVVFAPKGGGKSAIYSMLVSRVEELFDRGVLLAAAENPQGNTAFADVEADPPTSEAEFINIWKLYFLVLVAKELHTYGIVGPPSRQLFDALDVAGLMPGSGTKRRVVRTVMDYVRRWLSPASAETSLGLDPASGLPISVTGKITFREPSADQRAAGVLSVDDLYELANAALSAAEYRVWLVLDRLDVAFADSRQLEENALRALFRAYRDLQTYDHIKLKIFLRSDIWKSITSQGFREASHITRELSLTWTAGTLLQLVMQRLVSNPGLCAHYGVEPTAVLASAEQQRSLFYRIYPDQVELGTRKPRTYEWCLARTQDGHGVTAPRELIHLLSEARVQQLRRFEIGERAPDGSAIIDRQALKDALPEVSGVRLTKTLFAEYPALQPAIERMEGQKTHHNDASLAAVWDVTLAEARVTAERLVEIGFFERRGDRQHPTYWVPFLYRPALKLVQGSADGLPSEQTPQDGEE